MREAQRISTKLDKFRPSLTLGLKTLVQQRTARGLPVYDFGLGETKGHLNPEIRAAGEQAFRQEETMYADPGGLPQLRAAVLRWLGLEGVYGPDDVVITTGAKQALLNTFMAIANPADVFLFDAAPWVSYQPLAVMSYATPVMVLPRASDRLLIGPDDLERNIRMRPHARMFLLNNPVNPTAQMYDGETVAALARVCARHGVYFVLDRLYWKLVFDGGTFPEPPLDAEVLPWLVQIDGMSKNFRRAGGLRIGWSVGPRDLTDAMVNLQSHYTSGPSVPSQRAALAALDSSYDFTLVSDLQRKRDLLVGAARQIPHVRVWDTPATFYSFWDVTGAFGMRTPRGTVLNDSDDVAAWLCEAAGVVTASGCGFMQDGYLRLAFDIPDEEIVTGMAQAKAAFEALER
jgi:aspartate aminotransferase